MRFHDTLSADGFGAVAEFKRRSPSAGDIRPFADVSEIARGYERAGARAMSVLVDERFAGTWDDLRAARAATTLPLLAKGFFSTPSDLETALAEYEAAMFLRGEKHAPEAAATFELCFGETAPHGLLAMLSGAQLG